MHDDDKLNVDRREFFKTAGAGLTAAGLMLSPRERRWPRRRRKRTGSIASPPARIRFATSSRAAREAAAAQEPVAARAEAERPVSLPLGRISRRPEGASQRPRRQPRAPHRRSSFRRVRLSMAAGRPRR